MQQFSSVGPTFVEVSGEALLHNARLFKKLDPKTLLMAIVKSNAYGHGLEQTVQTLSGVADWFGVNSLFEAQRIRALDRRTPILIMGAIDLFDDGGILEAWNSRSTILRSSPSPGPVSVVVSSIEGIERFQKMSPSTPFHIKVDTGMTRLGLSGSALMEMFRYLEGRPDLPWTGLMTHFASADTPDREDFTRKQLEAFLVSREGALRAARGRHLIYHAGASATALLHPEARLDMIRQGISLYGMWPSPEAREGARKRYPGGMALQPVVRWVTTVVHTQEVPAGTPVGYGSTYQTTESTRLAILPVGYNEGYFRFLSNKGEVLIRGRRAKVRGRVCMNMIMVDVTGIPEVEPGDHAVLLGCQGDDQITAEELAMIGSTINYEITTAIREDLPRIPMHAKCLTENSSGEG